MIMKRDKPMGQRLREAGFTESRYNRETKSWTVGCSKCKALVINGVPCHELSCKNLKSVKGSNAK